MHKQQQQQLNDSDDDFFEFWTPSTKKHRTEGQHSSRSSPLIPSLPSRRGDSALNGTTLPPSTTPEVVDGFPKSKEPAPRTV